MPRGIPNQAKNTPVAARKTIESAEQPIGYTQRTGNHTADNAQDRIGEAKLIQVAERMPDPEHAAMLAFMNELVTIRPATSTDKNAEQVFELCINNKSELFRRGENKTVRRCYVDLMARLKVTSYSQIEVTNEQGDKQYKNIPHTGLKYDFAMVDDANPMGPSWLKATLAMPG